MVETDSAPGSNSDRDQPFFSWAAPELPSDAPKAAHSRPRAVARARTPGPAIAHTRAAKVAALRAAVTFAACEVAAASGFKGALEAARRVARAEATLRADGFPQDESLSTNDHPRNDLSVDERARRAREGVGRARKQKKSPREPRGRPGSNQNTVGEVLELPILVV